VDGPRLSSCRHVLRVRADTTLAFWPPPRYVEKGDHEGDAHLKAVVRESYGPPEVLRFEELEAPSPAAGEVLVRVRAASLNKADLFQLNPPL
jgi:hypothetical protein